jgi:hypothetical protein
LINDQAAGGSQSYTLDASSFARTNMAGIAFDPVQNLTLDTGVGALDDVTIAETAAGTNLQLVLGKVNNAVTVGAPVLTDPLHRLSLDSIQGPLNITGGSVGVSQLTFDDRGAASSRVYRLLPGTFQFGSPGPLIQFSSLTGLIVDGTSQHDVFVVSGTPAGTGVTLNTGAAANDVVSITAGPLDPIHGDITVNAQAAGASLTFDDSGNTNPATYTLTPTTMTRNGLATITYQNLAQLTLKGGTAGVSARDNYIVNGTAAGTSTIIDAGSGTNIYQLQLTPTSGSVAVNGGTGDDELSVLAASGKVTNVPDLSHPGNGAVTAAFASGTVTVQYQNIEHVHALNDVSASVATKFVSHFFNTWTHLATDAFTLTNTSSADIAGPLVIMLKVPGVLPFGFQFLGGSFAGKTLPLQFTAAGMPYISIPITKLAAGRSLTFGVISKELTSMPLSGLTFQVFSDA